MDKGEEAGAEEWWRAGTPLESATEICFYLYHGQAVCEELEREVRVSWIEDEKFKVKSWGKKSRMWRRVFLDQLWIDPLYPHYAVPTANLPNGHNVIGVEAK